MAEAGKGKDGEGDALSHAIDLTEMPGEVCDQYQPRTIVTSGCTASVHTIAATSAMTAATTIAATANSTRW